MLCYWLDCHKRCINHFSHVFGLNVENVPSNISVMFLTWILKTLHKLYEHACLRCFLKFSLETTFKYTATFYILVTLYGQARSILFLTWAGDRGLGYNCNRHLWIGSPRELRRSKHQNQWYIISVCISAYIFNYFFCVNWLWWTYSTKSDFL